MSDLYYTPPAEEQFDELKQKAIEIWNGYDNTYGYATEKIDRIKDIKNIQDNFMFIIAMFDRINQWKLADKLSEETRESVRDRMLDGGNPLSSIVF